MKNTLILSLLSLLAGALIYHLLIPKPVESVRIISQIKRDTIYKIEHRQPIIIEKIAHKITYNTDTIYTTGAFTAIIDTIIKHDTVYLRYDYPEHLFNLAIKHKIDTSAVAEIIIEISKNHMKAHG